MSGVFDNLPQSAFWRPAVVEPGPFGLTDLVQPKFQVTRDMAVATAGSCFAQHVGRALRSAGLAVLDAEPAPMGLDAATAKRFGFGLYSGRYGNIYTTRQLCQLLEDTRDARLRPEAIWHRDGRFFDALRPNTEPEGCATAAEVCQLRAFHLSRLRELFRKTALFVFTLGMTESWQDPTTGTVFPTAPGLIAEPQSGHGVAFRNFGFQEVLADLISSRRLLLEFNPAMRLILSVSPVPLTATASGRHVLAATTASKSILRAAVDAFVSDLPDVDYVPSYEIITHPAARGRFFAANLRSVTQEGVDLVMSHFLSAHGLSPLATLASGTDSGFTVPEFADQTADDVICEEAMAEAFRR